MRVMALLGLATGLAVRCEASGIAGYLTPQDRSKVVLISQNGLPITARAPSSSGNDPAYAAFPLSGGEHLPASIPTVTTTATAGPDGSSPVGPLDLTPMVQANLNAALSTAGMAVVQTPTRNYAVEYLPRYGLSQDQSGSTASIAESSQPKASTTTSTSTSSSNPLSALTSNLTIAGISASELSKWTSTGLTDLEKALHIQGSTATARKPATNVEAQYLPTPQGESAAGALPTAAPEPSTWLVFGLLLGVVGWRHHAGKAG